MSTDSADRQFWSRAQLVNSGCWEWPNPPSKSNSYAVISYKGERWSVHRLAWTLAHGPVPPGDGYHGTCVCHKCDNRKCVRPDHLFLGTMKDNMVDAVRKGRNVRGERQHLSKLTREQVREIRKRYRAGGARQVDLAAEFRVNQTMISAITRGSSWRHLEGES